MCRLLGFSSREPVLIYPYVSQMRRFSREGNALGPAKLNVNYPHDGSSPHPDGWGWVCLDRRGLLISPVKNDRPAFADPELRVFESVQSPLWVGHVRRASPGIPVTPDHAHPFEQEGIALAHNGTLYGAINERAQALGDSDSRLFLSELAHYWEPRTLGSLANALSALLEDEDLMGSFDAANLLIAEGKVLYGLRWCHRHEGYYTLYARLRPDRVELSSQPFDGEGWQLLENRELIAIQDGDVVERVVL